MTDFSYMLAPIERMTGAAFRSICHKYGADLTFTEMIRLGGLVKSNASTWSRIDLADTTPTAIQLFGGKESQFAEFLDVFEPPPGFSGFNLNYGCPSPEVVRLGQGCAMVRRVSKTQRLIALFRDRGFPVSIKMRLGVNLQDKEHGVYLKLISSVDPDFFIVHARHGGQDYSNPADPAVYEACVATGKAIIANGDITTKHQADCLKAAGLKGVMIGRAAVRDPAIFNRFKGLEAPPAEKVLEEYKALSEKMGEAEKYRNNILRHGAKPEG